MGVRVRNATDDVLPVADLRIHGASLGQRSPCFQIEQIARDLGRPDVDRQAHQLRSLRQQRYDLIAAQGGAHAPAVVPQHIRDRSQYLRAEAEMAVTGGGQRIQHAGCV